MRLSDSGMDGRPLPTCRIYQQRFHRLHRALSIAAAAGKGFGKVQGKDVLKVCKPLLVSIAILLTMLLTMVKGTITLE